MRVPRSTAAGATAAAPRQQFGRLIDGRLRDFIVAIFTLSVYHVLMVENLHSSDRTKKNAPTAANSQSMSTTLMRDFATRNSNADASTTISSYANAGLTLSRQMTTERIDTTGGKGGARRIPHPGGPAPKLTKNHSIMKRAGSWAPIVLETYKLLFFDVPKVGSTGFKQLFLRMTGSELWKERNADQLHWKAATHLRTLSNYTLEEAQVMMTSPNWNRVIFVRDPKERLLSAFLDKVVRNRGVYAGRACCKKYHYEREFREKKWGASKREIQCMYEVFTFEGFLHLAATECRDEPHWRAQSRRVDSDFWGYVNFVGYMDSIAKDTKSMLELLAPDAWDKYGASGWGTTGNESIFQGLDNAHHHTHGGASSHYFSYFTPRIEKEADTYLAEEYEHGVIKLSHRSRFQ